jgi:hypothetical protein
MGRDKREKTLRALRYIRKYQHLYQDEIIAVSNSTPDKRFPLAKQRVVIPQSNKFIDPS